ncbi:MAG: hypothetical protein IJW44_04175 [Clostridia bacterium]|nr:hypothetical protein [Clostridia bacterium]
MKKLLCLILCLFLLFPALTSCSKPPEYAEIEERFRALVEASAEINRILFGEGLATYDRATDPRTTTKSYTDEETGVLYHYYRIPDAALGEIIALRQAITTKVYEDETTEKKYFYYEALDRTYGRILVVNPALAEEDSFCLQLLDTPREGEEPYYINEESGTYGYLLPDYVYEKILYLKAYTELREGMEPYYHNAGTGTYYYMVEGYVEPVYESYYDEDDPTEYDYVRADSDYLSVSQIKEAAEQVYSAEYLKSVYDSMFVGIVAADDTVSGLSARYIEFADEDSGTVSLMKSNEFEPYIAETRQYDFSTAKMVKPSNGKYVTISIDSYLPSKPDEILNVRLSLTLQNGVWMLDSPTY